MGGRGLTGILRNLAVLAASTLFCVALLELAIGYAGILPPLTPGGHVDVRELARRAALSRGEPFDPRSAYEVIAGAREQGRRAFPAASPAYFLAEKGSRVVLGGEPVLPLAITALADNYYCNESGRFANFATDRFGFRNPDAVWDGRVDIVAVGDSYTMGTCLDDGDTIVGNLRRSGRRVLNLGMGANGPLTELASLVEYGGRLGPKVVLWNFFPNDFEDLERDRRNPILARYDAEGYSQDLAARAALLNPAVDAAVEEYMARLAAVERAKPTVAEPGFHELPRIRAAWRFLEGRIAAGRADNRARPDFKLLQEVLRRADAEARKIGASLLFVYIPDCVGNSYGQDAWKTKLFDSVSALGIEVIDAEARIETLGRAGQGSVFYCPGSHLNPAGAASVTAQVVQRLSGLLRRPSSDGAGTPPAGSD